MAQSLKNKVYAFLQSHTRNSYRVRDLMNRLNLSSQNRQQVQVSLDKLLQEGKLRLVKGNRYTVSMRQQECTGKLVLTQKGFGFVLADDGGQDIFIGRRQLNSAVHWDLVRVKLTPGSTLERRKGTIVEIIKRSTDRFTGTLYNENRRPMLNVYPVTPERGIQIINGKNREIKSGVLVETVVVDWGSVLSPIRVKIVSVIGDSKNPANDFEYIVKKYGFNRSYPSEADTIANSFSQKTIQSEIPNRKDIRKQISFTIDPEDAKDFDDAISIVESKSGWTIGVHIADVSYYVRQGSALDREAYERSTSVYFTEGVVPMLPDSLSSNLCSLRPNEDRLAFSVQIQLDRKGDVIDFTAYKSVIRSNCRFTYTDVQEILDGKKKHPLARQLEALKRVCLVLKKQRELMGSIDFDIPEPLFVLRESGVPLEISHKERLFSHRMVEECMLLANRLVADKYGKIKPFVFRVHEKPKEADLKNLVQLLSRIHPELNKNIAHSTSKDIRNILEDIENSPHKSLIESVALRSMTKAQYSTNNRGHFGLAFPTYTHFTSPIRRYPDLIVHRRIHSILTGVSPKQKELTDYFQSACNQSNKMELEALAAEREYIRIKQLRWLQTQIGKTFSGIISGVIQHGFFVELDGTMAEGLVPVDTLENGDFIYVEEEYMLKDRKSNVHYQLGSFVKIRVLEVLFEKQRANFVLADDTV